MEERLLEDEIEDFIVELANQKICIPSYSQTHILKAREFAERLGRYRGELKNAPEVKSGANKAILESSHGGNTGNSSMVKAWTDDMCS